MQTLAYLGHMQDEGLISECSIRVFHYKVTVLLESINLKSYRIYLCKNSGIYFLECRGRVIVSKVMLKVLI